MQTNTDSSSEPAPLGASRPPGRVVVGVDGSAGARAALVQALVEAARRGARLDVVTSSPMALPWTGVAPVVRAGHNDALVEMAARIRQLVDEVRSDPAVRGVPGAGSVEARVLPVLGAPAQVLVDSAVGAELLVVGSRGRGTVRSALLGSVALHCVTHAPCPTLVVRGAGAVPLPRAAEESTVVVGVDGSAESLAACRLAIEEAARRGSDVEVVAAYSPTDYWTDLYSFIGPSTAEVREQARERAGALVGTVRAKAVIPAGARAPQILVQPVDGAAPDVLVERSRTAGLVVVGSRGHGSVRGLLLGSVALHVAMHAACPVLVVRPAAPASADEDAETAALAHG